MNIKSILAVTDFSMAAEQGLERAALLAARHQAKLRIIYGAEVPNLGLADPMARLQQRGRQLARRHSTPVEVIGNTSNMLDDLLRHARSANLLVVDHRNERSLSAFWRGTTLDQLLRRCPCPILIVKQEPQENYKRIMVAIDGTVQPQRLVQFASGVEVHSELEVFHSFEALNIPGSNDGAQSNDALRLHRRAARPDGLRRAIRFSDYFETRRNRVTSLTGRRSEPAREIAAHQNFAQSDLIVVGNQRRSTLADFLFGNVAGRLANLASSDVLVFPHDYQAPSGALATDRIRTLLNRQRPV